MHDALTFKDHRGVRYQGRRQHEVSVQGAWSLRKKSDEVEHWLIFTFLKQAGSQEDKAKNNYRLLLAIYVVSLTEAWPFLNIIQELPLNSVPVYERASLEGMYW